MALINKINVGDTTYDLGASLLYGVCETASATAAKVVTVTGNFTLETGATIAIKFTNTNTASSPTLNVNGTGAKAIKRYGTTAAGTAAYTSWQAGQVVIFVYDGTQWQRTYNETYNGDITGVTAGIGLTGGGSSGAVTIKAKLQDETALTKEAEDYNLESGSVSIRPVKIDSAGNLAVEVNDVPMAGAGAPIALAGYLWTDRTAAPTTDVLLYSSGYIGAKNGTSKGYLLHNMQIAPDAREFCQIKPTWTLSGTTLVGTATITELTNYYEGLTLAVILDSSFGDNKATAQSFTLNINSLGAKTIRGLSNSYKEGQVILMTYYGLEWKILTANSSTNKVKQYNIVVQEDLANGNVHWNQYFPLLTQYNRDSSNFSGETAYTSDYYLDPITNGLVAPKIKTDNLNAPVATTSVKGLMSPDDKTKLDNLNIFSNVKVGSTTVAADTATDTIEFVGSNITLTPDVTNDKVTFSITKDNVTAALGYTPPTADTKYSAGTGLSLSGTTFNHSNSITAKTSYQQSTASLNPGDTFKIAEVKYDAQGHVTGVQNSTLTLPSNVKFVVGGGAPIRLAGLVNSIVDNATAGTNGVPLYSNMYIQRSSNDTACDNIYNARLGANQGSGAVIYIEGPSTDTTAGTWTGSDDRITEYYNGLTIIYVPAIAGADTTTLNINGLGAKTCYTTNASKLTTQYSVGVPILLTFQDDAWKRADYNSNTDTKVRQYFTDGNKNYPLLMGYDVTGTTTSSYKATYARHNNNFYINPSTGLLTIPKLTTTGDVSVEGTLSVNGASSTFGSDITIYNKSFTDSNGSAILIKMPDEIDAIIDNVNGYGIYLGHGVAKSSIDITPYYFRCYNALTAIQLGKTGLQIGTGFDTSDVNALTGLKVKIGEDGQLTLDSSLKSQWQTALGIIDYNSTGLSMINKTIEITNRQETEFTDLGVGYLDLATESINIGASLNDGFYIEGTDIIFKINTNGVPEGDSTSKTGWRNYLDIYVQDTEPDDSTPVGAIWIDTSVSSITYAEDVAF